MTPVARILATPAACALMDKLRTEHGCNIIFHQSGGCCDGSAPMCFEEGEFRLGESDVCLGEVHGAKFYMSGFQFEYWKHTQLTLDVVEGRGASFSIEIPHGVRFLIRSRIFTEDELDNLVPVTSAVS
ncbi:hypothetical protein SAMN05421780_10196 [Flexibacter flexilis DSM 6793]|uniref:UDP-glucose 4-epimerase n=1 Tax=Flexibacter flexilis DSM 6793 TaxID=927664 RepID=A0A1I1DCQ2_9BACT|nr:DUF779 domain-containing protein [Flexibacter flexilis]SFB72146.1 hypothetical protein SAMN05421780_10196 [Flexibacter flexilis DSM 6793]